MLCFVVKHTGSARKSTKEVQGKTGDVVEFFSYFMIALRLPQPAKTAVLLRCRSEWRFATRAGREEAFLFNSPKRPLVFL